MSANIAPQLKLNKPQFRALSLLTKPRQTVCTPWGRGVGKSWFMRNMAWLMVARYRNHLRTNAPKPFRGIRIIALAPTLKQFKAIHGDHIIEEIGGEWGFLGGVVNKSDFTVRFPCGSKLQPFPAAMAHSKHMLGLRGDMVIGDECDDIDPSVFDAVSRPWFSEPWSLKMRLFGGTPRRGRHGLLYRLHRAGKSSEPEDTNYHSIHATHLDAPEYVDPQEVEDARHKMLPATFAREWECDFDSAEGIVYPFDEDFHVRKPPPVEHFNEFILGLDYGWVDPGCLLLIGLQGHGRDTTAWVIDEHYQSACPTHTWDQRIKDWNVGTLYPDPSQPGRIDEIKRLGVRLGKTDNSILAGVNRVANMLVKRTDGCGSDQAHLFVAPHCKNTIAEFGKYRRRGDGDTGFDEKPEDKHNHAMDALRYAIVGRFGLGGDYRTEVAGR